MSVHAEFSGSQARWFEPLAARLRGLESHPDPRLRGLLRPDEPLLAARAPGRLDVMGGIADYSGARVLEMPLARAAFVAVQDAAGPHVEVATLLEERPRFVSVELERLAAGDLREPLQLRAHLAARAEGWAGYVLGCLHFLLHRAPARPALPAGMRLLVASDVPVGQGVSSSAALEVAAMTALAARAGVRLEPEALAAACQWVENHVVGAPCGVMDQMTAALGREGRLLRLLCQPALVEGFVEVPPELAFFGIDSGVRHAVSGADYGTVRAAAFMGYRILADREGLRAESVGEGRVRVEDPRWGGFLANVDPAEFERRHAPALPEHMTGAEFLARYAGTTDAATRVEPGRSYPVRAAAAHPVHDHARTTRFAALLEGGAGGDRDAAALGELMYASHDSYGRCGLGSPATDRLVALIREAGPAHGLFGARITGGGSGGTVAVLARPDALPAVRALAVRYRTETGRGGSVFARSGPGALMETAAFGEGHPEWSSETG